MQGRFMLSYKAAAAIEAGRIVKFAAADNEVQKSAAATDISLGVAANENFDVASGETVDVVVGGVCRVKAGGTITRGALLVSDANGKAVVAAPAAGTNNQIIGRALAAAVLDDLVDVLVIPVSTQG